MIKPDKLNKEHSKFKKLLEYFVTHLEWVHNKNDNNRGVKEYIEPLVKENNFKYTGQGYNKDNIQKQIKDWDEYTNGRICISVDGRGYTTKRCYLNWEHTGLNVIANWSNDKIETLSLENVDGQLRENLGKIKTIDSLGLFDNSENIADELIDFYDSFNNLIINYNAEQNKNKHMKEMEPFLTLLKSNYNLILTGAPGTGKTYLALKIAEAMNAEIEFVQFHPSYDYTDFVEGLRPYEKEYDKSDEKNSSELGFRLESGIFKKFCKEAIGKEIPYVIIIDEINRAEISKVFGELFFSIDPGYRVERGKDNVIVKVKTQYSNLQKKDDPFKNGFYVPENVYIIGTMNDIDRSVESFDFAMRRRFAWSVIKAKDRIAMWDGTIDLWKDEALIRMNALNLAIEEIPGLSSAFHIGPAYFLKLKNYKGNFNELWENHLKGVLFEYLRGMLKSDTLLNDLKEVYDNPSADS